MILHIISRILAVGFGFLLAAIVSIIMLVLLGGKELGSSFASEIETDALPTLVTDAVGVIYFAASLGPAFTILPALAAIIIGEVARIRSVIYYMLTGGAAVLAIPLLYVTGDGITYAAPNTRYMIIFTASGFIGGFVYWLIAGRRA